MKISISKLPAKQYQGDWHDRPLKWLVTVSYAVPVGYGEQQKFCTKKEAMLYATIRRSTQTEHLAMQAYAATI